MVFSFQIKSSRYLFSRFSLCKSTVWSVSAWKRVLYYSRAGLCSKISVRRLCAFRLRLQCTSLVAAPVLAVLPSFVCRRVHASPSVLPSLLAVPLKRVGCFVRCHNERTKRWWQRRDFRQLLQRTVAKRCCSCETRASPRGRNVFAACASGMCWAVHCYRISAEARDEMLQRCYRKHSRINFAFGRVLFFVIQQTATVRAFASPVFVDWLWSAVNRARFCNRRRGAWIAG